MNFIKKLFGSHHMFDIYQALPLLAIAGLILVPDSGSMVVLYALGISLLVSSVSHIVRKVLFPYVNLQAFTDKALESPVGAAIVFFSVVMILAVIIASTCLILH